MDDSELQAIRAKRMAELKASQNAAGMAGAPEKEGQMEQMRHSMLSQILSSEARERLARIRIVKEDKAKAIEDMLIRMAQGGQIRGKVSEQQFIDMLEQVNESQKSTKITISRRRDEDSDDEDYGF